MSQNLRRFFLTLLFLSFSSTNLLSADAEAADPSGEEPVIDIVGTVADHDYFKAFGAKIYLPRIFYWEDAEGETTLTLFSSTKKALADERFEQDESGAVLPVNGSMIVDMSITSHLVYFWFSLGGVILLTGYMAGRYRKGIGKEVEPKGAFQNVFEILFIFVRDDIARENIDDHKADRYVPYLFTVFMGIAFMNLFGLLPWAATATADLTVTGTLAVMTFFITQFSGTKDYWAHIFWFPGVPTWVRAILTPVEFLGLFTKPFALAIRLFANMLSGKIMIIAVLGLIFIFADAFGPAAGYGVSVVSVALTAALYALKAFVALLQAYIFTLLSAVFIGMAAEDHSHGEEEYYAEHAS